MAFALSLAMAGTLCACGSTSSGSTSSEATASGETETSSATLAASSNGTTSAAQGISSLADYRQDTAALTIDNSKWQYDSDNNVYYQIGISYCSAPQAADYETMGIYVPGAYMTGNDNGDGTYTCTVNSEGKAGNYTASTAPIVFPVNTPGYAAQSAPTSYSYDGLSDYLSAGLIYVYAGMRGRLTSMGGMTGGSAGGSDSSSAASEDSASESSSSDTSSYDGGAPWGVTDLKAAIRCYRLNASSLPGNTGEMYSFGMSGGGAQSALAGSTGDSTLYYPYLTAIGAAMVDTDGKIISDAVQGSMCWCPITTLDEADEAYEWNMGQFSTDGTRADGTWTAQLSKDLASSFADYIAKLGLKDSSGETLTLSESSDGIYQAGSYYDYMMSVVETSLNNFLSDTTFPYTPDNAFNASGNFGGGGSDAAADNEISGSGMSGSMPSDMTGSRPSGMGGGPMGSSSGSDSSSSTTYATVQDYIDAMNADGTWITYDATTNTAKITSLEDFVKNCKTASKDVGAFDATDRSQGENALFGDGSNNPSHFDSTEALLITDNEKTYSALSGWDDSIVSAYADDLAKTDSQGNTEAVRVEMYNPMYYLCSCYDGYQTSTVAKHWRIRTGIDQGDTALTTETNLALALQNDSSVSDVDFATVWGMQHTMAERTGDSTTNFISWVNDCVNQDSAA